MNLEQQKLIENFLSNIIEDKKELKEEIKYVTTKFDLSNFIDIYLDDNFLTSSKNKEYKFVKSFRESIQNISTSDLKKLLKLI